VPDRLAEVIVLAAAMDAWGHHVACRRTADIEALLCQTFADYVTIGHHADKPIALANRDGTYIMLAH
jgi:hypothetical protein